MTRKPLLEQGWLLIFSSLFLLGFSRVVASFPVRASKEWNVIDDFGITEWMINYQGGFVRRGLPGSLLHWLYARFGVAPDGLAIAISMMIFIVVCCYLIYRSRSLLPAWVMLTTPLLGYMIYMGDSFVRKDSLLLLLLAIAMRGLFARRLHFWSALSILVLPVIAILSHEIFVFLFLPASLLIFGLSFLSHPQAIQTHLLKAGCLLPSVGAAIAVFSNRGSLEQALKIKSSWQAFFSLHPNPDQLGGSIGWLQRDRAYGGAHVRELLSHEVFHSKYITISYIAAVVALFLLAILLIAATIRRADFRLFFLVFVVIQILAMLPVFRYAIDYGRWVALCLNSALIITMESTNSTRKMLGTLMPSSRLPDLGGLANGSPFLSLIVPLGLGLWGLPHCGWVDWFVTSPFGSLLSPLGLPGPLRMLKLLMRFI